MTEPDVARLVRVYPTDLVGPRGNRPPAAGRYHRSGDALCFVPRFPFLADTSYTVLVHQSLTGAHDDDNVDNTAFDLEDFDAITIIRTRPPTDRTARVVEIYPTSPKVPRNHLRFYIHFSAPMSEGDVASHVHVVAADTGKRLAGALLPTESELWDPDRRRVTVLLDPARIKRGLAPHVELGYPLREGVPVEVVVDDGFRDAEGIGLAAGASRHYDVGADVRRRVEPADWHIAAPRADSLDALIVGFDRPLDHALAQRCLAVVGDDGRRVDGRVAVAAGERSWAFTPDQPWRGARHELLVDTALEDLGGNSVTRVFDRDLSDPGHAPIAHDPVRREIRPW